MDEQIEPSAFCEELVQLSSNHLSSSTPLEVLLCILRLGRGNTTIESSSDQVVVNMTRTWPIGWKRKLDLHLNTNSSFDLLFTIAGESPFLDQELRNNMEFKRLNIFNELQLLISNRNLSNEMQSLIDQDNKCIEYSKSKIWIKQQLYYQNQKYNAWSNGDIPYLISSNRAVAVEYMIYITKEIQSYRSMNNDTGHLKICILEIAAGHGILSYLLAKQAAELHQNDDSTRYEVIATDFHDNIFKDLLQLPWFNALCTLGVLDFAVLSTKSTKISPLLHKGGPIGGCDLLFIVGNYAFDSFPIDLVYFNKENDQIFEINKGLNHSLPQSNEVPQEISMVENSKYILKKSNEIKYLKYKKLFQLFGSGVYQIPVAGETLLQAIHDSVVTSKPLLVRLVIGDCVVINDDRRWSSIPAAASAADYAVIDFDPPLISEENHVAFPVNPFTLGVVFHEIFRNDASHSDRKFMDLYSPFTSAFSVVLYSNGYSPDTRKRMKFTSLPLFISFPPYELSTLRAYVSEYRTKKPPFTASFYRFIVCILGKYDLVLFCELQYMILTSMKSHDARTRSELIADWIAISKRCIQEHYSINGFLDLGVSRTKIIHFLVALNSVTVGLHHAVILDACKQLLHYSFLYTNTIETVQRIYEGKSLIVCLSLHEAYLYCKLLALAPRSNENDEVIAKYVDVISADKSDVEYRDLLQPSYCLQCIAQGRDILILDKNNSRAPKIMKKINKLKNNIQNVI